MKIRQSAEDYLEAILMLQEEKGYVRSVDIAERLNVTKPSVSIAMKKLRENGFLHMGEDNLITLTDRGYEIASRIYDRHKVLTQLFVSWGVAPEIAREDACRVEHDISEETFSAIKRLREKE